MAEIDALAVLLAEDAVHIVGILLSPAIGLRLSHLNLMLQDFRDYALLNRLSTTLRINVSFISFEVRSTTNVYSISYFEYRFSISLKFARIFIIIVHRIKRNYGLKL